MKTVVVTGANRGIGLGIAEYYKAEGYNVIATSRKPSQVLVDLGVQNMILDVASDESIAAFASQLNTKIDLLINNSGILNRENIETVTRTSLREHFDVNTAGPLLLTQALLPHFTKGAKITSISSSMGCIQNTAHPGFYL
jgi:NAD(P)-dependent dehydrogenase (short-subunit alcohol dehydrogenase family)